MTKGFFTRHQTESRSRPDGKTYSCVACGLYRTCHSPRMEPFGEGRKGILCVGEAPGEVEDSRGRPWQGKTGRRLKRALATVGVDLFEDCWSVNAVNCRPQDNARPTNFQIDCCRSVLNERALRKLAPEVIILLGNAALYSFLGHRWPRDLGSISKWRGWTAPDRDYTAWVCPVFHPSYVERADAREVDTIWHQDLARIANVVGKNLPRWSEPTINIVDSPDELRSLKPDQLAFDYETTGLKPHATGHRIVCAAVSPNPDEAVAFMMPTRRSERTEFTRLLTDPRIGKMAHNLKFEDTWSAVRLRTTVCGWSWDSMLAAHLLDNRQGVTSLKFQTYVNLGVVDYESEVSPYLGSVGKGGNAFNRIDELLSRPGGRDTLLRYCALDAVYEHRLALLQQKQIDYSFLPF